MAPERFDAGHDRGASHGDERVFCYLYDGVFYVEMAVAADEGWQRLERDAGQQLLFRTGSLHHGDSDEIVAMAAAADRGGVAVEILDPDAAMERWPGMRFTTDVLLPTAPPAPVAPGARRSTGPSRRHRRRQRQPECS